MGKSSQRVMVTGGAGYIGSHAVRQLLDEGFSVVVVDDLSQGHISAVDKRAEFFPHDIGNESEILALLKTKKIDAVVHFAGFIEVGESVKDPSKYYVNNVSKSISLLNVMREAGVRNIVFSSTAAVYGDPEYTPIDENHPLRPVSPYGESKRMIEAIIKDYATAYDFNFAILRYFNVAGASLDGKIGEQHEPESHLIPRLLLAALSSGKAQVSIYGTDYATVDGTCVRDYVHVVDLVEAHILALKQLFDTPSREVYNLGSETGFSVREVIATCRKISGLAIETVEAERRDGDAAILIAKSSKIRLQLGWKPKWTNLDAIVSHAWNWHKNLHARKSSKE